MTNTVTQRKMVYWMEMYHESELQIQNYPLDFGKPIMFFKTSANRENCVCVFKSIYLMWYLNTIVINQPTVTPGCQVLLLYLDDRSSLQRLCSSSWVLVALCWFRNSSAPCWSCPADAPAEDPSASVWSASCPPSGTPPPHCCWCTQERSVAETVSYSCAWQALWSSTASAGYQGN